MSVVQSVQIEEEFREIDFSFPYDIHHRAESHDDYNSTRVIKCITDEVFHWYIQYPGECEICDLGHYGIVPECRDYCRFKPRTSGGELTNVDTVRDVLNAPGGTLLLHRAQLIFNWENKLPFVFRAGKFNYLDTHHINGTQFDDRIKNISFTDKHRKYHGIHTRLRNMARSLNEFSQSGYVIELAFKQLIKQVQGVDRAFENIPTDSPRVWKYIYDMKEVIEAYEKYGQVPDTLKHRIKQYHPKFHTGG